MGNPILDTLSDLLRRQIEVIRVDRGPEINGVRKYAFVCKNRDPIIIELKGTNTEIVVMYQQARVYWDMFKDIRLPPEED